MDVRFVPLELGKIDALRFELIAFSYFADERPLRGAAGLCDWRLCGQFSRLILRGWLDGTTEQPVLTPIRGRLPFDKALFVGMGLRKEFDQGRFDTILRVTLDRLAGLRLRSLALALPGRATGQISPGDAVRGFLQQAFEREDTLDEVVIMDDADAHRLMTPVLQAERRRRRTAREISEP